MSGTTSTTRRPALLVDLQHPGRDIITNGNPRACAARSTIRVGPHQEWRGEDQRHP
jgi:hypothetical protein